MRSRYRFDLPKVHNFVFLFPYFNVLFFLCDNHAPWETIVFSCLMPITGFCFFHKERPCCSTEN